MPPSCHLLSISIGFNRQARRWDFEEVRFDDCKPYLFGEENDGYPVNAEEGLRAICLLALHVERKRMRNLGTKIPERLRGVIEPCWNSRTKAGWPSTLFGDNPWKRYIHGKSIRGDLHLDFDETVNIEISFAGLRTGQSPPTIDAVLLQFRTPATWNDDDDPLIINVRKADKVISSLEQKGSLRPKTQIKLEITAPIHDSICVFWIDSGINDLSPLYPKLDPRLNLSEEEGCRSLCEHEFRIHHIPAERTIGISGTGGVETCLVLRRQSAFDKKEATKIQEIIEEALTSRNPTFFFEQPKYLFGTSEDFQHMERQVPETRLGSGWQIEDWEAQLATMLKPHYDWLHLFHIPNRGSQMT